MNSLPNAFRNLPARMLLSIAAAEGAGMFGVMGLAQSLIPNEPLNAKKNRSKSTHKQNARRKSKKK